MKRWLETRKLAKVMLRRFAVGAISLFCGREASKAQELSIHSDSGSPLRSNLPTDSLESRFGFTAAVARTLKFIRYAKIVALAIESVVVDVIAHPTIRNTGQSEDFSMQTNSTAAAYMPDSIGRPALIDHGGSFVLRGPFQIAERYFRGIAACQWEKAIGLARRSFQQRLVHGMPPHGRSSFSILLFLSLVPAVSFAQNVRFDLPIYTVQAQGGNLLPVYAIPGAGIKFYSCSGATCPTLATTYISATSSTTCPVSPTPMQVVLNGSSTCVSSADPYGNMGGWFQQGQYMATITAQGSSYNYFFTISSEGGGGNPCGTFPFGLDCGGTGATTPQGAATNIVNAQNIDPASVDGTLYVGPLSAYTTIQAAVNALPTGGKIEIQAGTYNLASEVLVNAANGPYEISGQGAATILNVTGTNNGIHVEGTPNVTRSNIHIHDLSITSSSSTSAGSGIFLDGIAGFTVDNVWINGNSKMTNCLELSAAQQGEISGGSVSLCVNGASLESSGGGIHSNGVDWHGMTFFANSGANWKIATNGADDCMFHDNHLTGTSSYELDLSPSGIGLCTIRANHMEPLTSGNGTILRQGTVSLSQNSFYGYGGSTDLEVVTGILYATDNLFDSGVTLDSGVGPNQSSFVNNLILGPFTDNSTGTFYERNLIAGTMAGPGNLLVPFALTANLFTFTSNTESGSGTGDIAQFIPHSINSGPWGIFVNGAGSSAPVYVDLDTVGMWGLTSGFVLDFGAIGGTPTARTVTPWGDFNSNTQQFNLISGWNYAINGSQITTANLADWSDGSAVTNYVATCITVVSSNCTAWAPRAAGGGGSGTVTSVAMTVPSWLTVGGSPITTSGTLAVAPTAAQTSHQVIGTCGSATTFGPCSLVAGDIPTAIPIANVGSAGLSATSPISIASTGAIAIQVANTSQAGYLASADWNTFNGKQNALSLIAGTYTNGDWCSYASSGTLLNCNNAVPQVNLTLIKGTYVDGDLCSYTASGTLLNCNTTPGSGTTTNALTGAVSGGAAPSTTFNGSAPITFDYHTLGAAPALGNNVPETTSWTVAVNNVYRFTGSGASNATTPASVTTGFIASIWNQGTAAVTVVTGGPTLVCVPSTCIVPIGAAASITTDGTNFDVQISNALGSAFGSLANLSTINNSNWSGTVLAAGNGGSGVANTATHTLGTSNQNWATLGTGIVKNTTTTGAISDAASADVIALWSGTCSSSTFLRGDGACAAAGGGSGTVTASPQWDIAYYPTTGTTATVQGAAVAGFVFGSASGAPAAATAAQLGTLMNIATNAVVKSAGTTSAPVASSITDNGTTIASAEPVVLGTANCTTFGTAGGLCGAEGTSATNVAGASNIYPDSTAHEWKAATNGSTSYGLMERAQPGAINQTAQTASISTATLCAAAAGACNVAGQYRVDVSFTQGGTACTVVTVGSVAFSVTYTDANGVTHSAAVVPIDNQATPTALSGSFTFTTSNATGAGSGTINFWTNGTVIQYATAYTGCTTGTGTYNVNATVTRLQ